MTWRVRFRAPVLYNAGHPQGARLVTDLPVNAPTADAAALHAIRVTQGEVVIDAIELIEGPLGAAPTPEATPDRPQEMLR